MVTGHVASSDGTKPDSKTPPPADRPATPTRPTSGDRAQPKAPGAQPAVDRDEVLRQREALLEQMERRRTPAGGVGLDSSARSGAQPQRLDPQERAAAAGAVYQPPSETSEVIRFEPVELDLGELTAEVPKSGVMKFVNISDKPVRISGLKAGCGCTTARAPTEPIPVGGSVEIPVTLRPGPSQGVKVRKHVDVHIEDEPTVRFYLHGTVAEVLAIAPDILSPVVDDPASGRITIRSVDGVPFRLLGATPAIIGDLQAEPLTEHVVHVDWDRWAEASRPVKVTFRTDHPRMSGVSAMIRRLPGSAGSPERAERPTREELTERQAAARRATAEDRAARAANAVPSASLHPSTSALLAAARRGDTSGIAEALAQGAKIDDAEPATGRNALILAAKASRPEVVQALLKAGARHDVAERNGKSPLTVAAEAGAVEVVRLLLAAGADVNHRDQIQGTALLWAAGLGNAETVRTLLAAKADPTLADVNGLTPLLWAAAVGQPESVAALLEAKVDMNVADRIDGDDALMRAARSGKAESVRLLLQHGARTDARNKHGATALHLAASRGTAEKVRMLVEAKADPKARNGEGLSALELAQGRHDAEGQAIAAYLETLVASR